MATNMLVICFVILLIAIAIIMMLRITIGRGLTYDNGTLVAPPGEGLKYDSRNRLALDETAFESIEADNINFITKRFTVTDPGNTTNPYFSVDKNNFSVLNTKRESRVGAVTRNSVPQIMTNGDNNASFILSWNTFSYIRIYVTGRSSSGKLYCITKEFTYFTDEYGESTQKGVFNRRIIYQDVGTEDWTIDVEFRASNMLLTVSSDEPVDWMAYIECVENAFSVDS